MMLFEERGGFNGFPCLWFCEEGFIGIPAYEYFFCISPWVTTHEGGKLLSRKGQKSENGLARIYYCNSSAFTLCGLGNQAVKFEFATQTFID